MPEGDTILAIRQRLGAALAGQRLAVSAPHPRGRAAGLQRLDGRVLERVDSHGKHLLLSFGELVLHSHLGMSGSWQVQRRGDRWRRPPGGAWALLSGAEHEAAQFGGPTLRVLADRQLRLDPQLSRLGPDILAPDTDLDAAVVRFRAGAQTRSLGDALLDQRLVAGIGNIYKSEACFAVALSPWRPLASVSDAELRAVLAAAREQMLAAVASDGRARLAVYGRRGPCPRCGGRLRSGGQGDANRTTWWCERCQS